MKARVAIVSCSRLGRSVLSIAERRRDLDVVAFCTSLPLDEVKKLLQHDAVYASTDKNVTIKNDHIVLGGSEIALVSSLNSPDWKELAVDVLIDCSEKPADESRQKRLQKTEAKRIIHAQNTDSLPTIAVGLNEADLADPGKLAISAGGAVYAAVAPVVDILDSVFGVETYSATTIDGRLDCTDTGGSGCKADCRHDCGCGSRCCKWLPSESIKAPRLVASVCLLSIVLKRSVETADIASSLIEATVEPYYQGIVAVSQKSLKPDSVIGESVSAMVDVSSIANAPHRLFVVPLWFDREWGYANRLVELAADFAKYTISRQDSV